jgi:hypothetical protein
MKKNNLIKLGDAIEQLFKQEKLDVKMSRFAVKNGWEEIAGKMVANHTISISFDEQKNMYLQLDSSVVKNEVLYSKDQLIKKINTFCGYELIKNMILK